MDLINIEGWIPREQILGDEARSKVPPVSSQSVYMMAATLVRSLFPGTHQGLRHLHNRCGFLGTRLATGRP